MEADPDERTPITIECLGKVDTGVMYCPWHNPKGYLSRIRNTLERLAPERGDRLRITVTGPRRIAIAITENVGP